MSRHLDPTTSLYIVDIAEFGDVLTLETVEPCSIMVPSMHGDLYITVLPLEESYQDMILGEIFGDHSCDDRGVVSLSILYHLYRDPSPRVCLDIIESEDDELLAGKVCGSADLRDTELITCDREDRLVILQIRSEEGYEIATSKK